MGSGEAAAGVHSRSQRFRSARSMRETSDHVLFVYAESSNVLGKDKKHRCQLTGRQGRNLNTDAAAGSGTDLLASSNATTISRTSLPRSPVAGLLFLKRSMYMVARRTTWEDTCVVWRMLSTAR